MKRLFTLNAALLFAFASLACGGGEPGGDEGGGEMGGGEQPPGAEGGGAAGAVTMPDWISHDAGANMVDIQLIAGETTANNAWNFNGFFGGAGEIFVPAGAEVTISLENQDQNMAHSVGVDERRSNFPANFTDPQPVFEGAISSNPTSLTESTMPSESESITFTAGEPGEYSLVCYVPGHAAVGMYIHLTVTEDGTVGLRE